MSETWMPVVGWETAYSVSNEGRVRSEARTITMSNGRTRRLPQRLITPVQSPTSGRMNLVLCDYPRRVSTTVDRLVLDAFVGHLPSGLERLHGDDDPTNNRLSNLRYGTRSDNMYDSVANGKHFQASQTHCIRRHPFTAENTYRNPKTGRRQCRQCQRIGYHRRKAGS